MNFTTKPDLKAGIVLARGRAGHTSRSHVIAGAEIPGEESGGQWVHGPPAPDDTRTCARRAGSDGDAVVLVFEANNGDPLVLAYIISLQQVT